MPSLHREAYPRPFAPPAYPTRTPNISTSGSSSPGSWSPYPDTARVFRGLRAPGHPYGSGVQHRLRRAPGLTAAGAEPDHVVLSYEVGVAKPDPQIFHIALDLCGVTPAKR